MDLRMIGFDSPLFSALQHMLDGAMTPKSPSAPPLAPTSATPRPWRRRRLTSRSARIPTLSSSTCRGLKSCDIKVQVEDGQCAGDQRREEA
ncbi:hypothetical protein CK203_003588 [Vitis vinifera]|uniref:Uncharacterized protein n=1 Tax=Vitis vinifera TaxID=29760 RepID=A0A438K8G7_VITVI|nr:hypothetical protein CK203_003588 [Vitis vinifera]